MRTKTAKRRGSSIVRGRATTKRQPLRLILNGDECDAAALKRRLARAVKERRDLAIDVGTGAALTTAGVQVLLAAAASAEARGLKFRLAAGGSAITEIFGELGLADEIAAWLDPAGAGRAGRPRES